MTVGGVVVGGVGGVTVGEMTWGGGCPGKEIKRCPRASKLVNTISDKANDPNLRSKADGFRAFRLVLKKPCYWLK